MRLASSLFPASFIPETVNSKQRKKNGEMGRPVYPLGWTRALYSQNSFVSTSTRLRHRSAPVEELVVEGGGAFQWAGKRCACSISSELIALPHALFSHALNLQTQIYINTSANIFSSTNGGEGNGRENRRDR